MHPAVGAPETWRVRSICSEGELASILNLSFGELLWFADPKGMCARAAEERLRHYRFSWRERRRDRPRLIEAPKQRLRGIQRWILTEILERIPPHAAAHGFRKAHSVQTFTHPHTARTMLLKVDLKDFFPSIHYARVLNLFLTAGYPEPVAELLAGLSTTITPKTVLRSTKAEEQAAATRLYGTRHLPQGSPSSPALANLCAYRLDLRLAGLARAADCNYTRYADDLLFSGGPEFARRASTFYTSVCRITIEEGFEINTRKTRVMRQGQSQRAAGIVLNAKQNIGRREYDLLKAILNNCVKRGAERENRGNHSNFEAHLRGRLAHFEKIAPAKAGKLWAKYEQIDFGRGASVR